MSREWLPIGLIGSVGSGKKTVLPLLKHFCSRLVKENPEYTRCCEDNVGYTTASVDIGRSIRISPSVWANYVIDCYGFIYVLDASNENALAREAKQLKSIMTDSRVCNKPILIFLNKQDLPKAVTAAKVEAFLELKDLPGPYKITGCVAKHAPNADKGDKQVAEGFLWLVDTIRASYEDLKLKVHRDKAAQNMMETFVVDETSLLFSRFAGIRTEVYDVISQLQDIQGRNGPHSYQDDLNEIENFKSTITDINTRMEGLKTPKLGDLIQELHSVLEEREYLRRSVYLLEEDLYEAQDAASSLMQQAQEVEKASTEAHQHTLDLEIKVKEAQEQLKDFASDADRLPGAFFKLPEGEPPTPFFGDLFSVSDETLESPSKEPVQDFPTYTEAEKLASVKAAASVKGHSEERLIAENTELSNLIERLRQQVTDMSLELDSANAKCNSLQHDGVNLELQLTQMAHSHQEELSSLVGRYSAEAIVLAASAAVAEQNLKQFVSQVVDMQKRKPEADKARGIDESTQCSTDVPEPTVAHPQASPSSATMTPVAAVARAPGVDVSTQFSSDEEEAQVERKQRPSHADRVPSQDASTQFSSPNPDQGPQAASQSRAIEDRPRSLRDIRPPGLDVGTQCSDSVDTAELQSLRGDLTKQQQLVAHLREQLRRVVDQKPHGDSAPAQSRNQEAAGLQQLVDELQAKISVFESERSRSQPNLAQVEVDLAQQRKIDTLNAEIARLQQECTEYQSLQIAASEELLENRPVVAELREQIADLQRQLESNKPGLVPLGTAIAPSEELRPVVAKLREQVADLQRQLESKKLAPVPQETTSRDLADQVEGLTAQLVAQKSVAEGFKRDIARLEEVAARRRTILSFSSNSPQAEEFLRQIHELQRDLDDAHIQLSSLRQRLRQEEERVADLTAQVLQEQAAARSAQRKASEAVEENQVLVRRMTAAEEESQKARNAAVQVHSQLADIRVERDSLFTAFNTVVATIADIDPSGLGVDMKAEQAVSYAASLRAQLADAIGRSRQLQAELQTKNDDLKRTSESLRVAQEQVDAAQRDLNRALEDKGQLAVSTTSLDKERAAQVLTLQSEVESLRAQHVHLKEQAAQQGKIRAELDQTSQELARTRSMRDALEERLASVNARVDRCQYVEAQLEAMQRDRDNVKRQLSKAESDVAIARYESEQSAAGRRQLELRCSALVDQIDALQQAVDKAGSQLVEMHRCLVGLAIEACKISEFPIPELQQSSNTKLIDCIREAFAQLQAQGFQSRKHLVELESKWKALSIDREVISTHLHDALQKLSDANARCAAVAEKAATYEAASENSDSDAKQLRARVFQLEQELAKAVARVESASRESEGLAHHIQVLKTDLQRAQEVSQRPAPSAVVNDALSTELAQKLHSAEQSNQILSDKLASVERELKQVQENAKEQIRRLQSVLSEMDSEVRRMRQGRSGGSPNSSAASVGVGAGVSEAHMERLAATVAALTQAQAELDAARTEAMGRGKERDTLKDECRRLMEEVQSLTATRDRLASRLVEVEGEAIESDMTRAAEERIKQLEGMLTVARSQLMLYAFETKEHVAQMTQDMEQELQHLSGAVEQKLASLNSRVAAVDEQAVRLVAAVADSLLSYRFQNNAWLAEFPEDVEGLNRLLRWTEDECKATEDDCATARETVRTLSQSLLTSPNKNSPPLQSHSLSSVQLRLSNLWRSTVKVEILHLRREWLKGRLENTKRSFESDKLSTMEAASRDQKLQSTERMAAGLREDVSRSQSLIESLRNDLANLAEENMLLRRKASETGAATLSLGTALRTAPEETHRSRYADQQSPSNDRDERTSLHKRIEHLEGLLSTSSAPRPQSSCSQDALPPRDDALHLRQRLSDSDSALQRAQADLMSEKQRFAEVRGTVSQLREAVTSLQRSLDGARQDERTACERLYEARRERDQLEIRLSAAEQVHVREKQALVEEIHSLHRQLFTISTQRPAPLAVVPPGVPSVLDGHLPDMWGKPVQRYAATLPASLRTDPQGLRFSPPPSNSASRPNFNNTAPSLTLAPNTTYPPDDIHRTLSLPALPANPIRSPPPLDERDPRGGLPTSGSKKALGGGRRGSNGSGTKSPSPYSVRLTSMLEPAQRVAYRV